MLTPNQTLRIIYANAWNGNVYFGYVADDARNLPMICYAVVEKDSKYVVYVLDQEDIAESCNATSVDVKFAGATGEDIAEVAAR